MNRLVFAGDLHLSKAIYHNRHPSMQGDGLFALQQIRAHTVNNDAGLVLLGDIVDRRYIEPQIFQWLYDNLVGLDIAFNVGQHDGHRGVQWLDAVADLRARHISSTPCSVRGFALVGFDCLPKGEIQDALHALVVSRAQYDILCLHQLFKESFGLEYHLEAEELPPNTFVVAGDYHGEPDHGITSHGTEWLYTGSSTMRSISEPIKKSVVLVERDAAGKISWKRLPLLTRPFYHYEALVDHELRQWAAQLPILAVKLYDEARAAGIPEEVASPFVCLRYSTAIEGGFDLIQQASQQLCMSEKLHLHLMPERILSDDKPLLPAGVAATVSVTDIINREADPALAPELNRLVTSLVHSSNPQEAAVAFKRSHNVTDNPLAK